MILCDRDRVYIGHIEVITVTDLFAFFSVKVITSIRHTYIEGNDLHLTNDD